ncbi:MAG: DUF4405 domain-containing protein [Chlorobiaceae bacterium]|nr:DUF4405 domain-containing protein [Chlorobiaceae bacterium]
MKKSFSWRALTSFSLFLSFMILVVSGVILYVYPGGIAPGISEFGGLTKPAWLNQHIIFSIIFTLFSLFHLCFINREAFVSYLKKKQAQGWLRPVELLATVVFFAFAAIGTHTRMQPFSGILNAGREIAGSMEQKADNDRDLYDNTTNYLERSHGRHGFGKHYEERPASPRIASRWEEPLESAAAGFDSGAGNTNARSANNGAPDDELHRRTKASCASCH